MNPILALDTNITLILLGIAAVVVLFFAILLLNFGMIWIRAWTSGAKVGFLEL